MAAILVEVVEEAKAGSYLEKLNGEKGDSIESVSPLFL